MKAIVVREFGGPEVLKLEEVPDPKPGAGDVLVRIRAAGVNPVDAYIHTGTYVRKPPLPYTPGFDGAGDVEAVGAGVTDVKPGDRVYVAGPGKTGVGAGTYAELAVCLPSQLHPLPARGSFAQGAALGVPYCTAYRALFQRAWAKPGDTVLVHGATGGVGNRGRVEIDPRQAMGRDAAILGMTLFNVSDADFVEIHAALIAGLTNGTLNPVVGREMPLADAARAHQAVMEPGAHGKIVLVP